MFPRYCSCWCSPPREFSVARLSERQLPPQKSPPKTFFVSSQVKYVAATNAQLRKGAWLQRSFTLSTLTCSPRDEPAVVGRAVASAEEVAKEEHSTINWL